MKYIKSVWNPKNGAVRSVFEVNPAIVVVVKTFGNDNAGLLSVKVWDISTSSLDDVMSHWSTTEDLELSNMEVRNLESRAIALLKQVS